MRTLAEFSLLFGMNSVAVRHYLGLEPSTRPCTEAERDMHQRLVAPHYAVIQRLFGQSSNPEWQAAVKSIEEIDRAYGFKLTELGLQRDMRIRAVG